MNRSGETEFATKESPAQLPMSSWIPATRIALVQSLDIVLELRFLLEITWYCKGMFNAYFIGSFTEIRNEIAFSRKDGCILHLETRSGAANTSHSIGARTVLLQLFVTLNVACSMYKFFSEPVYVRLNMCI